MPPVVLNIYYSPNRQCAMWATNDEKTLKIILDLHWAISSSIFLFFFFFAIEWTDDAELLYIGFHNVMEYIYTVYTVCIVILVLISRTNHHKTNKCNSQIHKCMMYWAGDFYLKNNVWLIFHSNIPLTPKAIILPFKNTKGGAVLKSDKWGLHSSQLICLIAIHQNDYNPSG